MEEKLILLLEKTFDFSVEVIDLCKNLIERNHVYFMKPLFESTTRMGVNLNEAIEFQGNRNYHLRLLKAAAEAKETLYWLKRIERENLILTDMHACIDHCEEIFCQLNAVSYA